MLNLKSFVLFSVDLLSRGGGAALTLAQVPLSISPLDKIILFLVQHFGMVVTIFALTSSAMVHV